MLPKRRLGELLVERGLITAEQLDQALDHQQKLSGRIGSVLVQLGFLDELALLRFLSYYYDVPEIDLRAAVITPQALKCLPVERARRWGVIPIRIVERPPDEPVLFIATPDPTDFDAFEEIREFTGCAVEPFVCTYGAFECAFQRTYNECIEDQSLDQVLDGKNNSQIARALAKLLLKKKIINCKEIAEVLAE